MATKVKTTEVGYTNRNRQLVVWKVAAPEDDHDRRVYILRCLNPECLHEYGAYGSDISRRKCPSCQGGKSGLPLGGSKTPADLAAEIAEAYDPETDSGEPDWSANHDEVLYNVPYSRDRPVS